MSKDPTKNIDRYKIRGGQFNAFEYHQNQGAVSEHQREQGNWMGAPEDGSDLPPDKAKAERIRHLLAEHGESVPQTDEPQTQTTTDQPSQNDDDRRTGSNASEEDFAPTHGRSPEIIQEMIQSRRATDRVPDPEDIIAGHLEQSQAEQSQEKKEHGETRRRTATRRTNKQTKAQPKSAKAANGKEAAIDRTKPGVATGTTAKKQDKKAAPRRSTKQASTTSTTGRGTAKKQTAASSSRKQTTSGKSANQRTPSTGRAQKNSPKAASTRSGAGAKSAKSRPSANGKATSGAAKSKRATTSTRAKSSTGKSR